MILYLLQLAGWGAYCFLKRLTSHHKKSPYQLGAFFYACAASNAYSISTLASIPAAKYSSLASQR